MAEAASDLGRLEEVSSPVLSHVFEDSTVQCASTTTGSSQGLGTQIQGDEEVVPPGGWSRSLSAVIDDYSAQGTPAGTSTLEGEGMHVTFQNVCVTIVFFPVRQEDPVVPATSGHPGVSQGPCQQCQQH